jgi:predicted DNA binding CopG/RHH family protein
MKKLKKLPKFKNEAEEAAFWQGHDSAEYLDWSKASPARFAKLKLSTETISLRLPKGLLEDIKIQANKQDVPYQSLMKVYLSEKVREKAA